MADIFQGALVSLECLGSISVPEHRFLDAVTDEHRVKLSPNINPPFTGAHWEVIAQPGGTFAFASAGDKFGFRYLDGRTQDGVVQVVGDTLPPFSGARWEVQEVSPGIVTILCRGDFVNPEHRFLDGHTQNGEVRLAPHSDPPFTGTRWRVTLLGTPSIDVDTKVQAIRTVLTVQGSGFTPDDEIEMVAEGIGGRQDHAPFPISRGRTHADGTFKDLHGEVGFFATHPRGEDVTIRVFDQHGITATGRSAGFNPT
jgi:hypothetical protein